MLKRSYQVAHLQSDLVGGEPAPAHPHRLRVAHVNL